VLEVKQVSPIHDGVREIQTYTDVRVWQNRAVLYTRSKIDVGVAFNVASSRDEALLRNLDVSAYECRRHDPGGALYLCSLADPNAGLYLCSFRAETAT
jgi:hypothetical protein